jgi:uncharacterized membrane protein
MIALLFSYLYIDPPKQTMNFPLSFPNISLNIQIIGTILLIMIDAVYLTLQKPFYRPIMVHAPKDGIRYIPAFLSWFVIILGIQLLVLSRKDVTSGLTAAMYGALLGFSMYALYNATNGATIQVWTSKIALVDTLWGSFITAVMSFILFYVRAYMVPPVHS